MFSVCGVVQLTFLCFDVKINTDAIGFFVTQPLTIIHILDVFSLYGVVYKAFVGNKKKLREDQLTTITCKMEIMIVLFPCCYFFILIIRFQNHM